MVKLLLLVDTLPNAALFNTAVRELWPGGLDVDFYTLLRAGKMHWSPKPEKPMTADDAMKELRRIKGEKNARRDD